MAAPPPKRQISFYLETELINRLDRWLRYQQARLGYQVDRSHIVNTLLTRFLAKNLDPKEADLGMTVSDEIE